MIEAAYSIHDYLPLRRPILDDIYIKNLWDAFERLTDHEFPKTQGFSVSAFHLLFMTAVQHKLFRLFREKKEEYKRAFILAPFRKEDKKVLLNPSSAFDLSRMRERSMFSLFEIVGLDFACIKECKRIIDQRNGELMHASGTLQTNAESAIENYLKQLDLMQDAFIDLNNLVADELLDKMEQDEGQKEFIEKYLYLKGLTRADFRSGKLKEVFGECIEENF